MEFYATVGQDDLIYGAGFTREDCLRDHETVCKSARIPDAEYDLCKVEAEITDMNDVHGDMTYEVIRIISRV